mgnify:FL=1
MKTLGQIIKEARKEKRITQRDLAKSIDVDFTYISKIETGALEPPSETVINRIAKILDIDANELFLLAKKVPTEFKDSIIKEDTTANILFRKYQYLTEDQKERIKNIIEE